MADRDPLIQTTDSGIPVSGDRHPLSAGADSLLLQDNRIRRELEDQLEKAAVNGTPVLMLLTGGFLGPGARPIWFSQSHTPRR